MNITSFQYEMVRVNERGVICDRHPQQNIYFAETLAPHLTLKMVKIPQGNFQIRTISPFWMGMTPITRSQYQAVMGRLPDDLPLIEPTPEDQIKLAELEARFNQQFPDWLQTQWQNQVQQAEQLTQSHNKAYQQHPVEGISWYEALEFCQRLSALTQRNYRLPSEAEWEYACRAGTQTDFHFGNVLTPELANYRSKETEVQQGAVAVGQFPPNAFGLYDLHGNVWEWCADNWHHTDTHGSREGHIWQNQSGTSE